MAIASLAVFAGFYTLDFFVTGAPPGADGPTAFDRYVGFDSDTIPDAVTGLAAMIAAVLGIVITVVSIIVQLSADRYTGVARMFLRDRVNIGVMTFYVIATSCGVWVSLSVKNSFMPRAAIVAMLIATTIALAVMLPYFAYVFWFLDPSNIVARIRQEAVRTTSAAAARDGNLATLQADTLFAMEELTDITSNSISGKDKIIASRAVDALKDFALEYIAIKGQASPEWFGIGAGIRDNPDFVAMDPESLIDLEERRTWVEWKVLRQYFGIFNEALAAMRDINYLVAIDTRYIGEAAGDAGDEELIKLVYRYMNSYMRATLNARDVRTAYNLLNQYRKLIEAMIRRDHSDAALEGVGHITYYAQTSFDMQLAFVTETAAYDISALCQLAHQEKSPAHDELLARFLELDRSGRGKSQEKGLLGVRKAQVKLAAYYLSVGADKNARLIADDMKDEPAERLETIRAQLERVTTKDFWEIIDRGRNFEFMPEPQRRQMATYFGWLGIEGS